MMTTLSREETLLRMAAHSILHGLSTRRTINTENLEMPAEFRAPGACFVTLLSNGQLRGCIGSAEARRSLGEDLLLNAHNSAFNDIRFPRLRDNEIEGLEIELSILTTPKPLLASSEDELVAKLRPGVDGLIIEHHGCRALFLPSVWDSLPRPREFVNNLKRKAGIPSGPLKRGFSAWRFETEKICSRDLPDPESLWED